MEQNSGGGKKKVSRPGAQMEEMKDPHSMNCRIYISGLPAGVKEEDLASQFGMLGTVAKKKDGSYKINLYTDESGKPKGDAVLTYEDPNAAQTAPEFFNDSEFKGSKIEVELAKEAEWQGRKGGRR